MACLLQAVMDTNKAGHATRMDIYNTCDDIAAVLQVLTLCPSTV